jgi:uncharacterized protein (TIGR03790 family)
VPTTDPTISAPAAGLIGCVAATLALMLASVPARATADSRLPTGLTARDLAVIVNTADPLSVEIGSYYAQRRQVPPENVVRVHFGFHRSIVPAEEFAMIKAAVDAQLPSTIQAYALTWTRPYRVDCMSITAAFAFGFDERYCARGCVPTQLSRYFNSNSRHPFDELQLRPTMSIAAENFTQAQTLIDRGVKADGTAPHGTAYLLTSGDLARDVRAVTYPDARMLAGNRIRMQLISAAALEGRPDVMFYFIGAVRVPDLETNQFLPGSVADHLTSYGGALTDGSQMSSLRWLEAGAAGSYGTVVEPCNIAAKFPNPGLLMLHYLSGETLIESYWKSVAMPGQGLFIGEPLAAPYRKS